MSKGTANTTLIKKPQFKTPHTDDPLEELGQCIDPKQDPYILYEEFYENSAFHKGEMDSNCPSVKTHWLKTNS